MEVLFHCFISLECSIIVCFEHYRIPGHAPAGFPCSPATCVWNKDKRSTFLKYENSCVNQLTKLVLLCSARPVGGYCTFVSCPWTLSTHSVSKYNIDHARGVGAEVKLLQALTPPTAFNSVSWERDNTEIYLVKG